VKDLKEEFVRDYIFPCLRAGAIYERKYLLGTSMARPVIAKVCSWVACHLTPLLSPPLAQKKATHKKTKDYPLLVVKAQRVAFVSC